MAFLIKVISSFVSLLLAFMLVIGFFYKEEILKRSKSKNSKNYFQVMLLLTICLVIILKLIIFN